MTTTSSPSTARKLADLQVADTVRDAIDKELDRLERMGEQSPEHAWVRNWLDAVFELPWGRPPRRRPTSRPRAPCSTPTTKVSTR